MIDGALALHTCLATIQGLNVSPVETKEALPKCVYTQTYEEFLQSANCDITTTQQSFMVSLFTETLQDRQKYKLDLLSAIKSYNLLNGNPLFLEYANYDVEPLSNDKFLYKSDFFIKITK